MTSAPPALRRTPLFEEHVEAGAKLVDFAGWEMPVFYGGPPSLREEHMAIRKAAGIFDVSHMGEIETSGPQAVELLQRLLSNDIAAIPPGGAQYSVLCREDGGVLDDLFTYRLEVDRYLTITNAANHLADFAWFEAVAADFPDARVSDRIDEWAMMAVQGPLAREIVQAGADGPLPERMSTITQRISGEDVLVCGTGYTGEDGVELLCSPAHAPRLWSDLVRRGAKPAGLGARDTLRLEVCFHLYGNELTVERGPIEAGLGWCCKEDTGFIGAEAVRAVREAGAAEKLVAFEIDGPGIARQGNTIAGRRRGHERNALAVSGAGDRHGLRAGREAAVGRKLEIDVRGRCGRRASSRSRS